MFRKPPISKSSNPVLAVEQLQGLVTKIDEQNEELLSGGIKRLVDEFPSDLAALRGGVAEQPEAEGKIRGTLLLSLLKTPIRPGHILPL